MRRLSIARSVSVALLGLTIVLAIVAGVGVAAVYNARQRYDDRLANAYGLDATAGRLLAAAVVEEATLRTTSPGAPLRAQAETAFGLAVAQARDLAGGDPRSQALLTRVADEQASIRTRHPRAGAPLRARAAIDQLTARAATRREAARASARSDTRTALIAVAAAGVLALLSAIGLLAVLLARMRSPLDDLVGAAGRLAGGDLHARVREEGPAELRSLGHAFNAMAGRLDQALGRVDAERRRLSQTIESLGDGLVVIDGDGTVVATNPRASELVPELAPGTALRDATELLPALTEAIGGEVTFDRSGRTLAATAAYVENTAENAGSGVVWTVRDVSERARLERLKSEFVATASHELRSPLTSIKGFVELLGSGSDLNERQREFLDIILLSTNRLVDLVNDLLDVARIEAGQVEIERRAVDLGEVAREVVSLMGPRLADKRQRLELQIADELPPVLADPARIRQVLINLLTNAHLYTPEHGHLAIRVETRDGSALIEVADDGPGMGPEELDRIFERFYRGPAQSSGTGLGLAIVKSLVDLHGGAIAVSSRAGEGTTFTVQLPLATSALDAHALLSGRRVLVVDDEPNVASLIVARLADYGAEGVAVHSGMAAIERLRAEQFDAVTLDILMPGMSGFDVLREIRADPQLDGIPIVVVSVFSAREALAGECVVSKPIDAAALADALGSAVLNERVRVLVVARPGARGPIDEALRALGIAYDATASLGEALEAGLRRRYELALVDAGLPEAAAVLERVRLRGRRPGRALLVVGIDGEAPGLARLDATRLRVEQIGDAILSVLDLASEQVPAGATVRPDRG